MFSRILDEAQQASDGRYHRYRHTRCYSSSASLYATLGNAFSANVFLVSISSHTIITTFLSGDVGVTRHSRVPIMRPTPRCCIRMEVARAPYQYRLCCLTRRGLDVCVYIYKRLVRLLLMIMITRGKHEGVSSHTSKKENARQMVSKDQINVRLCSDTV